MSNWTHFRSLF